MGDAQFVASVPVPRCRTCSLPLVVRAWWTDVVPDAELGDPRWWCELHGEACVFSQLAPEGVS